MGPAQRRQVLLLLEDHFYFSHDFDVTKRLQRRAGRDGRDALTELPSMMLDATTNLMVAGPS
jgi:hypothetical protein